MRSGAVRKGLWFAAGAFVLAVAVVLLLPYAASTQIVRNRIALELSAWSGYRVELGADPQLALWPSFRTELYDVRFSAWNDPERRPVLAVERIDAELSALEALFGHVVFSNARLVRPTVHWSSSGANSRMPPLPEGGRLAHAVASARAAVADDSANPDRGALPDDPFGRVEFADGRVVDGAGGEIATGITGSLEWPALNRAARMSASGIWRGENVNASFSAQQFLLLLGGGASELQLGLDAAPIRASFTGRASGGAQAFVEGDLSVATPSLGRMLEWSGRPISGKGPGSIAVSAAIAGDARRLKLSNAEVVLDGKPGEGVLEVSLAGKVPSVSGTLAFGSLDFGSFLSALSPGGAPPTGSVDTIFADRAALDIRLSAAAASIGSAPLTDIAATIQVKEELVMFDISDASAFGGAIQAGIRFDRRPGGDSAEIRFIGEDLDGVALASALGWDWLVPAARTRVSATLKGPARTWDELVAGLSGSVTASFGEGAVAGFDIATFLDRMQSAGFFPLADLRQGTVSIGGGDVAATVDNGVARIQKAELRMADRVVMLTGLVPFPDGGLALSGDVLARTQGAAATSWTPELGFFVGGSWRSPYVTAVPPDLPPQ
ncbi:MAG: AsmA-like C-terminal region-containing protein [Rhizobiaceae bacterium]